MAFKEGIIVNRLASRHLCIIRTSHKLEYTMNMHDGYDITIGPQVEHESDMINDEKCVRTSHDQTCRSPS